MVKSPTLNIAFLASALLHVAAIPVIAKLAVNSSRAEPNIILVDFVAAPPEMEKPGPAAAPAPPPKLAAQPAPPKVEAKAPEPPPPPREVAKAEEIPAKPPQEGKTERPEKSVASSALPGGGDARTPALGAPGKGGGAGNFSPPSDVAMIPGPGLGKSGAGQGAGPPGPGTGPARGYRPGAPIQTVKAAYPPMALRLGLEADVPLKVSVDEDGRVTKVEITKSAGMGFDEEAVKTVKQYRFEPATSDGRRVATEFSYVYRFRIQK